MTSQAQVFIAHTGQRLQVDVSQFSALDEFKALIARQSSIPAQNIVALNSQGKSVRIQTIQSEREIYIYDLRITQSSSADATSLVSEFPIPKSCEVSVPPNAISDTRSIQSWQSLFKSRRDWALGVVEDCGEMASMARTVYDEMDVMLKCLDAALANLDAALKPTEARLNELKKWTDSSQEDHSTLAVNWESYLDLARSVPAVAPMVRFMTSRDIRKNRQYTLEDLVEPETARKAGNLAAVSLRKWNTKVADLDKTSDKMFQGCDELFAQFDQLIARSVMGHQNDTTELLQDIEVVAKKIDTDYQATLQYSNPAREISQASKTAANHTKNLLPTIQNRAMEMDEMLRYAAAARNETASMSIKLMRKVAESTGLLTSVKSQMNLFTQQEEEMTTFDYLRLIQQLPYMYASFVVEAIRRKEWSDKIKADSSTLANEMALFQDEELKRRRKWQKTVGSTYGPDKTENSVMGIEVNLLGEDERWPKVTKQDLDEFIALIKQQKADASVVDAVTKLLAELNTPTKQQSKRLKAFKNGSVHEAALGKSGLLIRGDDDLLRTLQENKTKLESRLKTAESRVRRLEDLLHRQSQASRPSLGSIFQAQSNDSTASVKAARASDDRRRSSASDASEALQNRIAKLEGDLNAEKERSAILEQESQTRTTNMQGQMDEANSTKKDLLGNMEALKREFTEERKSLEEEIKTLKARLEETEDEIEHFGESRENEKVSYDGKVEILEGEVKRLVEERKNDALKAQGQVEFLRNESRVQRERNVSLERQLQEARETIKSLTKRTESAEESTEAHAGSLRELHSQLAPEEQSPADFADLIESVANKSTDILTKAQSLEQDLSLLKADLELAQGSAKDVKTELSSATEKLSQEEAAAKHLRESLEAEKARCQTLQAEVDEGRSQLNHIRTQMTEGETGSETLRGQLVNEEKKVAEMAEQLASRQSQAGGLEEEIRMLRERTQNTDSKYAALSERFDERNGRAKDLTQRLYTQNERLCRLLERLNFSITRKDGGMVIQKIPRSERAAQNPNDSSDPGTSIRRSVSLTNNALADSADLKLLYWMNAEDAKTEEDQYEAYMAGPGNFDVDAFSEVIYRRIKEIEHSARKLNRDAKGYRERAHTIAKESHDKIAFKSFKEGDLALFLPTRNQTTGAWAAFNVGCPHFFLREQEGHRLRSREWLVARITKVQERVVDLSKSCQSNAPPSEGETDSVNTGDEFENPFDLSDGLRWWLIDAQEDKPGAPSTPGLGKSTVAANTVAAVADVSGRPTRHKSKLGPHTGIEGVSKTLSKSLESRRSSTGSRKALPFALGGGGAAKGSALASETNSMRAVAADSPAGSGSPTMGQSVAGPSGTQPQANTSAGQVNESAAGDDKKETGAGDDKKKDEPSDATGAGQGNDKEVRQHVVDTLLGP